MASSKAAATVWSVFFLGIVGFTLCGRGASTPLSPEPTVPYAARPATGAPASTPARPEKTAWSAVPSEPHPEGEAPRIDIAFVIDATGSMQPVIDAAKSKIREIAKWIDGGNPKPSVRFGLVAFRDKGDAFVTATLRFSPSVSRMHDGLSSLRAEGGGDLPEHVVAGLAEGVSGLDWDPKAKLKLMFLLGDAAPHFDYGAESDVTGVLAGAKAKGIVIGAIACGDKLGAEGDAFWKKVADETQGPFERIASDNEISLESVILEAIRMRAQKAGISY